MDPERLAWCDVDSETTLQFIELIEDRPYWCCLDCGTILGPVEHHDDGVDSTV